MKVVSTAVLLAFALWLGCEFNTWIHIKAHIKWSEPNFQSLIESLAECRTHADRYVDDCLRHQEARRTVITAHKSCKAQPTQPACSQIKANITEQQALFDDLVRLSPAYDGYEIALDRYWSPENDWLNETWGDADRRLAIRSAYGKHWLGFWATILGLLVAGIVWFEQSAQREANRKWERLQAESLRVAEQEHLLEIQVLDRRKEAEETRERMRQAEEVRQHQLSLEKAEADRLAADAAARAEIHNKLLAERQLAKAKLERFQAAEAADAIASAITGMRRRNK